MEIALEGRVQRQHGSFHATSLQSPMSIWRQFTEHPSPCPTGDSANNRLNANRSRGFDFSGALHNLIIRNENLYCLPESVWKGFGIAPAAPEIRKQRHVSGGSNANSSDSTGFHSSWRSVNLSLELVTEFPGSDTPFALHELTMRACKMSVM